MKAGLRALGGAQYFYMVTFEIAPQDEREFNEIYDNEHIPDLLKVEGVTGVLRLRDGEPNEKGGSSIQPYILSPGLISPIRRNGKRARRSVDGPLSCARGSSLARAVRVQS